MSIIHRTYVLSSNGYITDDFGPVYRAVSNFRRGLDIYNEHFNYVDPHYLYPPGGTLLMAPFGYLPVFASHNWFVAFNTLAMIIAACLLVRLFGFSLTSVALPALLLAMFCTESVTNTLVFTNINGCILLAEVLPNVLPTIGVLLSLEMGIAVIVEAILSFVNLSISSDDPTWGGMIAEGRTQIHFAWWVLVFPMIALFLTVLSFSQFGEGLKDRFDPVLR